MNEKMTREERFTAWIEKMLKAEEAIVAVVKPVVNKYDPEQLLKMGCPADEYDPECVLIAKAIVREGLNRMSVQELGTLIANAWHYEFGMWGTTVGYHPVYYKMAEEIHPLLPEYETFRGR
jgi:hypothetical protein